MATIGEHRFVEIVDTVQQLFKQEHVTDLKQIIARENFNNQRTKTLLPNGAVEVFLNKVYIIANACHIGIRL